MVNGPYIVGMLIFLVGGIATALCFVSSGSQGSTAAMYGWALGAATICSGVFFLTLSKILELLAAINTNLRVTNSYLKAADETKPDA